MERRKWLKLALAGVVLSQIPWMVSCDIETDDVLDIPPLDGKGIFTNEEMKGLFFIQNILVPNDGNGPSAATVNAHDYFVWTLEDKRLPTSEKEYFTSKLKDLLHLCKEKFSKNFIDLPVEDRELFVTNNIESGWTQTFLSRMITVIFEAMLLDPVYGGNPNEIGWDWLEHIGGSPRANAETKYPEIYKNIPVYG